MKSIILTSAPIEDAEQKILTETNIFKLALNHHAEKFKPNARIITDYVLPKIIKRFPENIISIREKLRYPSNRVEYPNIEFKGSTMVAAVEYLILKGFDEILIVGDNRVYTKEFQNLINEEISKLAFRIKIYQYRNGNFHLPAKTLTEFVFSRSPF